MITYGNQYGHLFLPKFCTSSCPVFKESEFWWQSSRDSSSLSEGLNSSWQMAMINREDTKFSPNFKFM